MAYRLLVALCMLALLGLMAGLLHLAQRRRPRGGDPILRPTLILVTSRYCGACPPQKRVVAALRARYDPNQLEITILDAEANRKRVGELRVLTVPTTLLLAADGTITNVNNGPVSQKTLERQIQSLFASSTKHHA